ncbi:serine dehydratase [Thermotoga sp. Ku-13t]|uniref:L-serine ammonia-lyase, iron-sulfur-dependent, subunit beta n=1 Tax=Thermotoga sp. Ku-13t TaxID=1755813 RepID=UPI0013ED90F3|nr:L-serine ammonia-lyase, iron-sulfur-dependent, subunit alpha [Thermotoga sp. Ku-13t]KAF2958074.1 serine dehydratase [Thermotoga sp. Ku-13t]
MTFSELLEMSRKAEQPFHEIALVAQMLEDGSDPSETRSKISLLLRTMLDIAESNYGKRQKTLVGLCGENAYLFSKHTPKFINQFVHVAMTAALSVSEANSAMKRIVACPTAGSCGVMHGVVYALAKVLSMEEERLVEGLIVAGVIGNIVARAASISGAQAGCQAEIGTAAAMASGMMVYVLTRDAEKSSHAAAICLKSLTGLVCDPIGGFVEVPCVKRNATAVAVAIAAAEMALAGVKSVVPFDEVVEAMAKVGKSLPEELRETGLGGIAATKTALKLLERFFSGGGVDEDRRGNNAER